jgi:subtilisin family serine protease
VVKRGVVTLRPAWSDALAPGRLRVVAPLPLPEPLDRSWAWGGSDGTGVVVAVVDGGVEAAHPLVGPVARAASFVADPSAPGGAREETDPGGDPVGHGTACAGVIRSVAPGCELISARVLGDRLTGQARTFAAGIRWAVAQGARVINCSLSSGSPEGKALLHDVADEVHFAGAALVCAANNLPGPTYPTTFAAVISVAAVEGGGFVANHAPPVDFGAPGIDVEVAWLGGRTIRTTGNSFAAPHVAGLAARVLAKHPTLTPYELKAVLRSCADNAVTPLANAGGADG